MQILCGAVCKEYVEAYEGDGVKVSDMSIMDSCLSTNTSCGGIYMLITKIHSKIGVYIGSTRNISRRIVQHTNVPQGHDC